MLRRTLPLLCLLTAFVLLAFGCNKAENGNSNAMATGNTNKAATTPAGSSTSSTSSTTASADKIGVPECDDFIAKYDACISDKVPEAARAQFKSAITTWRQEWKKLAANPQTKGTLAQVCKTAAEQQKTALASYKCNF